MCCKYSAESSVCLPFPGVLELLSKKSFCCCQTEQIGGLKANKVIKFVCDIGISFLPDKVRKGPLSLKMLKTLVLYIRKD